METKILIFEGAGCSNTGGNDVSNCRLRTRIKNNAGRVIYLEIGGHETHGHTPKMYAQYKVLGCVDHCFYDDRKEDAQKNYSKVLQHIERLNYEYTQKNILGLVNKNLNCSFTDMQISDDVRVHNTENPLC